MTALPSSLHDTTLSAHVGTTRCDAALAAAATIDIGLHVVDARIGVPPRMYLSAGWPASPP
jgi:hypothetical protein